MVTYQTRSVVCNNCGRKIRRGFRRFGPAQVRCGHCGTILRTGLDDWYDPFPFPGQGGRAGMVIKELLIPSWIGVSGLMGFVFNLFIFFPLITAFTGMVGAMPMFIAAALAPQGGNPPGMVLTIIVTILMAIGSVTMLLGILAYPLFLVVRLVRMIRECGTYQRTSIPPTWK